MKFDLPFKEPNKIDGKFGDKRVGYYHAGTDLNGIHGRDTDLGYELFPIWPGVVEHVSKKNVSYGNVVVYRIEGEWGTRWIRYCHCDKILTEKGRKVTQEDCIATLGKSGNSKYAHLHLDLIKKKPTNWRMYARDKYTLNEYFEDYLVFFKKWFGKILPAPIEQTMDIRLVKLDKEGIKTEGDLDGLLGTVRANENCKKDKANVESELKKWEEKYNDLVKIHQSVKDDFTGEIKLQKKVAKKKDEENQKLLAEVSAKVGTRQDKTLAMSALDDILEKYHEAKKKLKDIKDKRPINGDSSIVTFFKMIGDLFTWFYKRYKIKV